MRRAIHLLFVATLLGAGARCLADDSDLELTVSIPHAAKELPRIRWVEKGVAEQPHFHVMLRNISRVPQQVWGSELPVIEFTNAAGKRWTARPHAFSMDSTYGGGLFGGAIEGQILKPDECLVCDVYLSRADLPDCLWFNPSPPRGRVLMWASIPGIGAALWGQSIVAKPVECIIE